MIQAVIDTNVVVSGLLSPDGNEALIMLAIHQGLIFPCFSEEILTKYAEVLARQKFAFPPDEIAAVLAMFRSTGECIAPAGAAPDPPDPDDVKFLYCAETAGAEYIVTRNKRHFPRAVEAPPRIVGAGELLDRITFEI